MARKVNITEKLSFDENPCLVIRGEEYEVRSDAKTMLEIMGDFSNKSEIEASVSAYERMFSEKDRKRIDELKLPFKDLMTIISSAMELIQGEEEPGEQ